MHAIISTMRNAPTQPGLCFNLLDGRCHQLLAMYTPKLLPLLCSKNLTRSWVHMHSCILGVRQASQLLCPCTPWLCAAAPSAQQNKHPYHHHTSAIQPPVRPASRTAAPCCPCLLLLLLLAHACCLRHQPPTRLALPGISPTARLSPPPSLATPPWPGPGPCQALRRPGRCLAPRAARSPGARLPPRVTTASACG